MTARAAGEAWPDGRANGSELDREGLCACLGSMLGRKLNLCGGEAARVRTTSAAPDVICLALSELMPTVWALMVGRVGTVYAEVWRSTD